MKIRIHKHDANYLWNTIGIKNNPRRDNNDEQFINGNQYYMLYDYENVVIMAVFDIKDGNAAMDSNDFCDWENYDELYIVSDNAIITD